MEKALMLNHVVSHLTLAGSGSVTYELNAREFSWALLHKILNRMFDYIDLERSRKFWLENFQSKHKINCHSAYYPYADKFLEHLQHDLIAKQNVLDLSAPCARDLITYIRCVLWLTRPKRHLERNENPNKFIKHDTYVTLSFDHDIYSIVQDWTIKKQGEDKTPTDISPLFPRVQKVRQYLLLVLNENESYPRQQLISAEAYKFLSAVTEGQEPNVIPSFYGELVKMGLCRDL